MQYIIVYICTSYLISSTSFFSVEKFLTKRTKSMCVPVLEDIMAHINKLVFV